MARYADLKNDFVFRKVFAHHPLLTRALLNDMLGFEGEQRIEQLEILPAEQAPEVEGMKYSIVDVKCKERSGRTFVVEMQLLHVKGFLNRVVYNSCRAYTSQLGKGRGYHELADVIALSICNFSIWPDKQQQELGEPLVPMLSRWAMTECSTKAQGLGQLQYAFLELPKMPMDGALNTAVEKWTWHFAIGEFEGERPTYATGELGEVLEIANKATFSQPELDAYEKVNAEIWQANQIYHGQFDEGLKRGREEGQLTALRRTITETCELFRIELSHAQRELLERGDADALLALQMQLLRNR